MPLPKIPVKWTLRHGFSIDNDRRRIDVDERAFPDHVKQANDVLIAQAHAPVRQGRADQVLPVGAVDIDVALIGIHARALLIPSSRPSSRRMRVSIRLSSVGP